MGYIVQRSQSFDNFPVCFEFFKFGFRDGNCDRIYAQSGIDIGRVRFNIVDLQPELSSCCYKLLQMMAAGQLQMYFKMIGTILQ